MKNGYMKKSISVLLCLSLLGAMLLACVGCGGKKDSLVGDWEGEIDLTDALTDVLVDSVGDEEMMEYVKLGKFSMKISLSLDEDGDYTLSVDEKSLKKSMEGMVDDLKDGLRGYLEDMIQDEGFDMSVDEFCELMAGVSYDDFMDSMINLDDIMSEFEGLEEEGTYKVDYDDEELVLKSDDGSKTEFTFELDKSTLTLDSDEDFGIDMCPFELEKQ